MQEKFDIDPIDPSRITWLETVAGSKIKVRDAALDRLTFDQIGTWDEPSLRITTSSGATCVVPLRAIARVDLRES